MNFTSYALFWSILSGLIKNDFYSDRNITLKWGPDEKHVRSFLQREYSGQENLPSGSLITVISIPPPLVTSCIGDSVTLLVFN